MRKINTNSGRNSLLPYGGYFVSPEGTHHKLFAYANGAMPLLGSLSGSPFAKAFASPSSWHSKWLDSGFVG